VRRAAFFDWRRKGRPQQQLPEGNWSTWIAHPGRGWGKTDTGSHAVKEWDEAGDAGRIALVGATAADVRDVMVLGESGILAAYPKHSRPWYRSSLRCVDFHKTGGGKAFLYSAEEPERLRGPQHHKAWGDELAAWSKAQQTLNQIKFGLRLGTAPQLLLTTTPKAVEVVEKLVA
jgi:phage terminase large subunit-like protein